MTKCPKCGYEQESSNECVKCGLIFSKYNEIQERKKNKYDSKRWTLWDFIVFVFIFGGVGSLLICGILVAVFQPHEIIYPWLFVFICFFVTATFAVVLFEFIDLGKSVGPIIVIFFVVIAFMPVVFFLNLEGSRNRMLRNALNESKAVEELGGASVYSSQSSSRSSSTISKNGYDWEEMTEADKVNYCQILIYGAEGLGIYTSEKIYLAASYFAGRIGYYYKTHSLSDSIDDAAEWALPEVKKLLRGL